MVVAFKIGDFEFHEPPYTEEEEMEAYRRMAGGPVAMTSVRRPSSATKPVNTPDPGPWS